MKPFFAFETSEATTVIQSTANEPEIEDFTIEFWVKVGNPKQKSEAIMASVSSADRPDRMFVKIALNRDRKLFCYPQL